MFNIYGMTMPAITEKRKKVLHRLLICISLTWLGMILGISFLEAPLKFTAPGVTPEIGLSIGGKVFGAFNKIECALAIAMAILVAMIRQKDRLAISLVIVWSALAIQTLWLLPVLMDRIELILQGQRPASSPLHSFYIFLEILKAMLLAVYGFYAFRERS